MNPPVPTLVAVLVLSGLVVPAFAQPVVQPVSVLVRASTSGGTIHGIVRDDAGAAVGGVSVVAMGTTLVASRSDTLGRFLLALPPGDYILRASRDGYVSTFREPVRISSPASLERNITLVRQGRAQPGNDPAAVIDRADAGVEPGGHAHTDLAWRLRHARRTVLRDDATVPGAADPAAADPAASVEAVDVPGLFDRAFRESARRTSAFLRDTDFDGQVNWMTSGSIDLAAGGLGASYSGSTAYLAVGAPVGTHGSWLVRGALSPGAPSSWVLLGEYQAEPDERHAFRTGLSYGALRPGRDDAAASTLSMAEARSAGAAHVYDRWQVTSGLEVSYGLRVDAYDYVAETPLLSPQAGARVAVNRRTWITVEGYHLALAPGAAEFQPPDTRGLWMPPDRTFSSIRPGVPLRAERIGHVAIGVERAFGSGSSLRTVSVGRFWQSTARQFATLFGLGQSGSAHYFAATVGDAEIDGWSFGAAGRLAPNLRGSVAYSTGHVTWRPFGRDRSLGLVAPSVVRSDAERLQDLSADLQVEIPGTSTRVSTAYRLSTGFSPSREATGPSLAGRFKIEVRQELPYQPIRGGTLDLLVGVRNLYRDLGVPGSMYDELLTVSPPVWFVGGIQIRF